MFPFLCVGTDTEHTSASKRPVAARLGNSHGLPLFSLFTNPVEDHGQVVPGISVVGSDSKSL